MSRWWHRLRITRQTHLVLGRAAQPAPSVNVPDGIELSDVSSADGPAFDAMQSFCLMSGFGEGWAPSMLEQGARGTVVVESGVPLAMAWSVDRAFYVEEISTTFDPIEAAYFFGDFVGAAHRGRRLQRLLVEHRLAHLQSPHALTLVHPENPSSIRSYQNVGFAEVGRIENRRWLGRDSVSATSTDGAYRVEVVGNTVRVART